jgi:DNA polymerase
MDEFEKESGGTRRAGGRARVETTWETLEDACRHCDKCALAGGRTNVVFGVGNRKAGILMVGEGPGEKEDMKGEPFVGKGGLLLDDMLKIIGLGRDKNVYIANIVKCRPPGNRDPNDAEQRACMPWLRAQYSLLKPKIVVCLGRIAAYALISNEFKITRDHGKWYEKNGVWFTAIFHPAALLRDPSRRPDTFVDLKNLQKRVREVCPGAYET